jgi:hypothetical protein
VLLSSFPEEFVAVLIRIEVSTNFADLIEVIKDDVEKALLVNNVACLEAIGFLKEVAKLSLGNNDYFPFVHVGSLTSVPVNKSIRMPGTSKPDSDRWPRHPAVNR